MRLRPPALDTASLFALGGALAAFPLASLHFFSREQVQFGGDGHFTTVGVTALTAAVAAIPLTIVGARRGDGGAVLALSALPALRRPGGVKPLLVLQAALLAAILGLGALGMLVPSSVPGV